MTETLAKSVGKTQDYSMTFEVADEFLEKARDGEWSEPVRFRFEETIPGRWDLVLKTEVPQ